MCNSNSGAGRTCCSTIGVVHEFSLADGILRSVISVADAHRLARVAEVRLNIGQLAGVSLEALEYAWQFLRETDARTTTAELSFTIINGQGQCAACGFTGPVDTPFRLCPACGGLSLRLIAGEEFLLTEVSGEPAPGG